MNALKFILGCIIMFILIQLCRIIKIRYQFKKFLSMALESEMLYQLFNAAKNDNNVHFDIKDDDIKEMLCLVENSIEYYDKKHLGDFQEKVAMETHEDLIKMASDLRRWIWVNEK